MYFAPIVCFIVPVFEFPVSPYEIASVGRNFAVETGSDTQPVTASRDWRNIETPGAAP